MDITCRALAFHLVGLIANTERKYIRARQDGVDANFAPINPARPAPLILAELKPMVIAIENDVVDQCVVASFLLSVARV